MILYVGRKLACWSSMQALGGILGSNIYKKIVFLSLRDLTSRLRSDNTSGYHLITQTITGTPLCSTENVIDIVINISQLLTEPPGSLTPRLGKPYLLSIRLKPN